MSKHRLLLADDSITIQKVVNLTFADEGIEVVSVGDGDSALVKINELAPDLVMVDVNMPGLNGYQICEKIKQDEQLRQIPVILLVGSFEPFDEAEAKRVGADDFMTKPFQSIRQLVNKVSELLESGGQKKDVPAEPENSEQSQDFVDTLSGAEESNRTPTFSEDDEMIEASQFSGTSAKTAKLNYDFVNLSENAPANSPTAFGGYQTVNDFEAETGADYATNQVKFADGNQFAAKVNDDVYMAEIVSDEPQNQSRAVYDFADQTETENADKGWNMQSEDYQSAAAEMPETVELKAETESAAAPEIIETPQYSADEIPAPSLVSAVSFDDFDLLELPPLETKSPAPKIEETPAPAKTPIEPKADINEIVHSEIAADENADNAPSPQLSSEMIEAIAQRVVEKLSEKFFDKQN